MKNNRLLNIIHGAGASATEIPRKEGWALLQAWREVYCAPHHEATGQWVIGGAGGYSWHTFSYEHFPCLEGRRALDAYAAQATSELLVLPERSNSTEALRYVSTSPIDFSGLLLDVFVAPANFEWTMVFTHEEEFGPYFSRAEWRQRGTPSK